MSEIDTATDGRWKSKVVLITGSSSGIGEAAARLFSTLGASVLVNSSRSIDAGRAVADSLPDALYLQGDVADETQCAALVDAALARWGRLDLLVNNAGTGPVIPHENLNEATLEVWREVFAVNVFGTWAMTVAAAPALARTKGSVVNVSSLAGIRALGSSVPYACSKAATNHMTGILAKVLGPDVRVNAVAPGLVTTPRTEAWEVNHETFRTVAPMRRAATPDDVAHAVMFLAESPYLTGEVMVLDGGFGLVR